MLKKISAALIAVSMLAAPAMAAGTAKNDIKTGTAPITKSAAPVAKLQVKPSVRHANAKMSRHHHRHYSQHRSHKKVTASKINKTSKVSKVTVKQAGPATKRG